MHIYKNILTTFARENRQAGVLSEALLWNKLKQSKLGYRFVKQKPIGKYIVDFYCPEKQLVIEIDGWTHNHKIKYDQKRDEYLKSVGLHVLRIPDVYVKQKMTTVLLWIKSTLDSI
ncbi:MAG: endonuclease domain-containing protein [Alphaproteobacteria bacterium]|nr:endonuclease domain-containing protein [Alphaproteobacteria bacterium]